MTDRPNVVIIYTDDLGWGDLGCFGSPYIKTPHLDSLAERGIRLTNWYVNSPVCSPSRAALMTGRHPAHAGVESILPAGRTEPGLPDQPTIASSLRELGYRTEIFGKWHLGVDPDFTPTRRGFDHHLGLRSGCVDYYSHIMYWGAHNPLHDLWSDDDEIWLNGEYLTDVITDRAVDFIEGCEDPFLCYVAYNAPHYPMHAPAEKMAPFEHLPWDQQVMAAMISCVDDGVGAIVESLQRKGILDNTIIIFSSDNGPSAESRNWLNGDEIAYRGGSTGGLRGRKGSLYEGGVRVPTIWSWPAGLPHGLVVDEPSQMMDVFPTIMELIGADTASPELDGRSVTALLRGEPQPERDLTWSYNDQRSVRRGRWKLVRNPSETLGEPSASGDVLFDLDQDPYEEHDLAAEQPERVAELGKVLREWEHSLQQWRNAWAEVS
jgi:arylsulfatase A